MAAKTAEMRLSLTLIYVYVENVEYIDVLFKCFDSSVAERCFIVK